MAERKQGAQCHTHSHSLKSSCFLSHIIFKKTSERIKIGNCVCILHFPGVSDGKESACNIGNPGSIPGSGRSPGEGNGNPLQCSCLENSMDRGAWQATVHGVTKSQTRLSN